MQQIIHTRTGPGLVLTLRAIGVCAWALTSDYLAGLRACTARLWQDYRDECERQALADDALAFEAAAAMLQTEHGALLFDHVHLQQADADPPHGAAESVAQAFGRPAWLSGALLLLVLAGVLVELAGAWPQVLGWGTAAALWVADAAVAAAGWLAGWL